MAPEVLQMVSRLPNISGLGEDTVENVLHVGFPAPASPTEVVFCLGAFGNFWTTIAAGATDKIGSYISTEISRTAGACQILAYTTDDLTGATPMGSPVGTSSFTMPASTAGTTALPSEVAVVISYHGDLTDVPITEPNPTPPPAVIRPAQRRRGRMYIGPLGVGDDQMVSGHPRPWSVFRTDLGLAFKAMALAIDTNTTGTLSVWSKADAATWTVFAGWVDDAWDVQRRRGLAATVRTPFTI